MSRNLVINTATERIQRKWAPSPEMAIREEENEEEPRRKLNQHRLIEEEEEEDPEDEDDEEEDEDEDEEEAEIEDGSDFTSSPSIPDENINFDLVYTLHTFEATVDGQASVKKGDALTLLDDSNSYWWLIRDLKTSEVGYIPAENIETPFERLARLNKHRNVELTSVEQATHYINKEQQRKVSHQRKVVLSTSLAVQLHVLLVGENEDEIEEETYEEWDEEMLDDDEDDLPSEVVPVSAVIIGDDIDDDDKPLQQHIEKIKPVDSKNNRECEVQSESSTAAATVNNHADPAPLISRAEEVPAKAPAKSKVVRVFAGNVDVGASYQSLRVIESTSVAELLINAMEKFHISQIETKHGRYHGNNSCVEYYLTVKTHDGDELTLDPQDKPYAIYESLTTHLTTPMPSLTQFRQLANTGSTNYTSKKKKRRSSSMFGESTIQFFMHKRIKRVNDKSGQVHIKVSLMTPTATSSNANGTNAAPAAVSEKMNAIKKMTTLRFSKKKSKKETTAELERIDKMIATSASITIAELTSIALVKFHIIPDINHSHHYRLILNTKGKDTLLNTNQVLSEVLHELGKDATNEKCFVLHNFSSNSEDHQPPQRSLSLSSSTSSSSSSSATQNRSTSIMTRLDSHTEAILKRVDAALEAFEKNNNSSRNQKRITNFSSPMSVSRNECGIDIHLPHGLLRSTALSDKKTQYSLMTAPNTLVLQKILPADNTGARRSLSSGSINGNEKIAVTGEEMAALIKYGSQYLDTYDTANKPSLLSVTNRLTVEKESEKSLSSLEDLEKELHRIITSHSS